MLSGAHNTLILSMLTTLSGYVLPLIMNINYLAKSFRQVSCCRWFALCKTSTLGIYALANGAKFQYPHHVNFHSIVVVLLIHGNIGYIYLIICSMKVYGCPWFTPRLKMEVRVRSWEQLRDWIQLVMPIGRPDDVSAFLTAVLHRLLVECTWDRVLGGVGLVVGSFVLVVGFAIFTISRPCTEVSKTSSTAEAPTKDRLFVLSVNSSFLSSFFRTFLKVKARRFEGLDSRLL